MLLPQASAGPPRPPNPNPIARSRSRVLYLLCISRISPVNLEAAKQVKGVDAEAVYLPYISRKYPVYLPYLPYISQVKGVDAEPVAATNHGGRGGACVGGAPLP